MMMPLREKAALRWANKAATLTAPESKPTVKPKQKRASKLVARPVVSACYPHHLPDPNDKPLPAVMKWRNAVLGTGGPRSPTTRFVLLALSYHMDADGGSCFPSHEKLAAETGLSVRCVFNQLKLAQAERWVVVTKKAGTNPRWKFNSYEASVPTYQDADQPDHRHLE